MFRVMAKMDFEYDTFHEEYSGIYHSSRTGAEEELKEAKLHTVDDETIDYLYIEEF